MATIVLSCFNLKM